MGRVLNLIILKAWTDGYRTGYSAGRDGQKELADQELEIVERDLVALEKPGVKCAYPPGHAGRCIPKP